MKKKHYICPEAVSVQLHDLMQVTVISGVADEDSLGRRLDTESDHTSTDLWDTTDLWQ